MLDGTVTELLQEITEKKPLCFLVVPEVDSHDEGDGDEHEEDEETRAPGGFPLWCDPRTAFGSEAALRYFESGYGGGGGRNDVWWRDGTCWRRCFRQVYHTTDISEGDLVAVIQFGFLHVHAIKLRPVGRAQVLHIEILAPPFDGRVMARYGAAGQHDDAIGVAPHSDHVRIEFRFDLNTVLQGENNSRHKLDERQFPHPSKFSVELSDANFGGFCMLCSAPFSGPENCMSAIAIKTSVAPAVGSARRFSILMGSVLMLVCAVSSGFAVADEVDEVEAAVVKLATKQEKEGFDFRADIWERQLPADLGKAVRVQFFKGNEYRVCVAVPPKSGVEIAAHVLDMEGKPVESKVETEEGGWGATLFVKPERTGVYVVVVRRSGGKEKATVCAMINGYK
jgi:hypothetical protein